MGAFSSLVGKAKKVVGPRLIGAVEKAGYDVQKRTAPRPIPIDFDAGTARIIERVRPYTLTSNERIFALREAVQHVVRAGIPGDIAECGVWRGGSMMVVALTLLELDAADRDLHLFDTFTEMPPPDDIDGDAAGNSGADLLAVTKDLDVYKLLPADEVRRLLEATGYPPERLHLVPGMVEDTIPAHAPERLALLRLDTDWYASTRHEMEHLFPRLSRDGVCIIDDYGGFVGARKAVDEYLADRDVPALLHRIDDTGRTIVATEAVLQAVRG